MVLTADQTAFHRMRVNQLINSPKHNARQKALAILSYIVGVEAERGSSFISTGDSTLYVFLAATREVVPIPRKNGDKLQGYLSAMYGLSITDKTGSFVYSELRNYAMQHAVRTELRRFAAYDTTTKTAYLSNYRGQMWKLDGGVPTLVDNGEDGIYFVNDDGGKPVDDVSIGPHGELEKLVDLNFCESGLGGMNPQQARHAMTAWMFMLAFPDHMPTKPMLIIEGAPGSGKSAGAQLIQLALMGASRPMILSKNKGDDFGVLLLRSPIALFDNTDSYIEWIPDAVCAYATTGTWVKRELYSDTNEVVLKPQAFIVVASKNPTSFRREDTADRCVVIRLERRDDFVRFAKMQEDVVANRSQLLGEYIHYVNQIVFHLRTQLPSDERLETSRMADFATFARSVSAAFNWDNAAVDEMMTAIMAERDAFISEEDPLVDLLHQWILYKGRGFTNVGREVNSQQLHAELTILADNSSCTTYYKSPRMLAQKLRGTHVDRDFIVQQINADGRKTYRIWRRSDAQLTVLEGEGETPPSTQPPALSIVGDDESSY